MTIPHKAVSSDKWDLIIVGGGIVGCSTALYAARSGLRVLIVERDTRDPDNPAEILALCVSRAVTFASFRWPWLLSTCGKDWSGIWAVKWAGFVAATRSLPPVTVTFQPSRLAIQSHKVWVGHGSAYTSANSRKASAYRRQC
ncbi:FAD-dependent oxidoreductase [Brucella pituitosa]|uniref:FAD-dependent oxidoreductase n=1 Tax=Brucella pituitosa TaxID=571256 RepID=UPI00209327EA|nr:FAD-dependent oxidoreductase [Brucella pituitosa]